MVLATNKQVKTYMVPKGPGKPGDIFADTLLPTQMFPRLPMRATFVADTNFKFVSGTQEKVSQFAQPKKHHGQQCVHNNVSSFAYGHKISFAGMVDGTH